MSFVACPKSHLSPRIIEVENGFRIADEVAPRATAKAHMSFPFWSMAPPVCNCLETAFTFQAL
ncbi:BQ5605_C030g10884 [Microbotryum silenes-dioicae]|uniref:BQ5605_C030g10867 protein n=1 Tax=Microbotryum silenes-dioicae TaxID=796604 RepID=A0A2X0MM43_9BASI|nr:BQ5605_C030g10867 [Microbotryum silenes-dioicae]SGZ09578.1 BQ5605_C030g10884 [Microbotryum silenes-dioicae]